jgi:hypothetical protein
MFVAISFKVDDKEFKGLLKDILKTANADWQKAGTHFRNITPIDTGNAKRNTNTRGKVIRANYGYASKLDEGHSRQAPSGMSDPTITYYEDILERDLGKL